MTLEYLPYNLQLKHPFGIAGNTRTFTPVIYVKLSHDGYSGYGEASLPPYLGLSQEEGMRFLSTCNTQGWEKKDIAEIHHYLNSLSISHTAIKAALDIAWHDWYGKSHNLSIKDYYNQKSVETPEIAFTIGIDKEEVVRKKIEEASDFSMLKIKLGSENDKGIIDTLTSVTHKPYYVDANQGWSDKEWAIDFSHFLSENNCRLIEQPFKKENLDDLVRFSESCALPVILDESFQRFSDLEKIKGTRLGVNIKLMKCTGIYEALKIIAYATENKIALFMGCMNESSCATAAETLLSPFCNYTDTDGPWLITNDPFIKPVLKNGKILLNTLPGLGLSTELF